MLGISIGGEFLDLSPGTTARLERSSPFFSDQDLSGEYSLPFTFKYTPKNARLLGLPNHYYTYRIKKKIAAKLHDKNNFSYAGELVIETAELDINDISQSDITGYYLTGVSSFFSAVKNKKLKQLQLGGVRNFAWTSEDPANPVKGFWQYAHDSLNGTLEYSFAPIRNEMWSGNTDEGSAEWMNKLDADGNIDFANNYNTLAPQVSLKYLLEQLFDEHGWDFDHSDMNDDQWSTLFMPSFYALSWQKIVLIGVPPYFQYTPRLNVSMNLQNHVPPEMYITDLIIALRSRYNWGFEFDAGSRTARMFPLKDLAQGVKKDWTKYMNPKWTSDFSEDEKIFSFRNDIDGNDELSSPPDLTKITLGEPVETFEDLPAAVEDNFQVVIYCWKANQYFQNRYNEDDNVYEWVLYCDNIYNFEPDGNNTEFHTVASTMPVYKTLFRTDLTPIEFFILVPYCRQEGNWEGKEGDFVPWGLRLLFHRGKVYEANPDGNIGTVQYPYLTSICFTITQHEPDLVWSNVYQHTFDGEDKGIITYWWLPSLKYLKQSDVISGILNLPRHELVNYKWSDILLLRNVPYIGQKLDEVIPYDKTVQAQLRRIG